MTNEELVELIQSGKREYEIELYNQNLPLIKKIATKFSYSITEPLEDLLQQAYFGLLEAVRRFDPGKGCLFVTYACHWIKQELRRYIANSGRIIRISEHARYLSYEYNRFEEYVTKHCGREPTTAEYAWALDVPESTVLKLQKVVYDTAVSSLDVPLGEDSEDTIADITADRRQNVEDIVEQMHQQEMRDALHEQISKMDPEQAEVILHRMQGHSVKQIAEAMGLSEKEVHSIDHKAIKALRINNKVLQIVRETGIVTW